MSKVIAKAGANQHVRITSNDKNARGITDMANSASQSVNSMASAAKDAVNSAIAGATGQITDLAASAKSALGGSISSITDSISKISDNIGNISLDGGSLSELADGTFKGLEETKSKIKSLASDAGEAIAKPVAYISKAKDDVLKGNDDSIFGKIGETIGEAKEGIGNLASSVATIASKTKKSISEVVSTVKTNIDTVKQTADNVKSAVNEVTTNLKNGIEQAKREIESVKREVIEPVVSTVDKVKSDIKKGADNILGYVEDTANTYKKEFLDFGADIQGMVQDVSKYVPSKYKDKIAKYDKNFAEEFLNKHVNDSLDTVSEIRNTIAHNKFDDKLTSFIQKVSMRDYPTVTDGRGKPLRGYGNSSFKKIADTHKAAANLCPGAKLDEKNVVDYKTNKNVFDVYMQVVVDSGMAELADILYNCPETKKYVDKNTDKLMVEAYPTAAKKGDASTCLTIARNVGSSNIPNPDPVTILANSDYSDETCSDIEKIRTNNGGKGFDTGEALMRLDEEASEPLNVKALVTTANIGDIEVIDAGLMFAIQPPNPVEFFDKHYEKGGAHVATLCNAAIASYGFN